MRFETTRWSLVMEAMGSESPEARAALAALCERYWPPVYAFIRSKGYSPEDAGDLTQGYSYSELAAETGTSEAALRVAVHRLRRRFGSLLREEIARTVEAPGEVDGEIQWLLDRLRSA